MSLLVAKLFASNQFAHKTSTTLLRDQAASYPEQRMTGRMRQESATAPRQGFRIYLLWRIISLLFEARGQQQHNMLLYITSSSFIYYQEFRFYVKFKERISMKKGSISQCRRLVIQRLLRCFNSKLFLWQNVTFPNNK